MDFVGYMRKKLLTRVASNPTLQQFSTTEELRDFIDQTYATFAICNLTDAECAYLRCCIEAHTLHSQLPPVFPEKGGDL